MNLHRRFANPVVRSLCTGAIVGLAMFLAALAAAETSGPANWETFRAELKVPPLASLESEPIPDADNFAAIPFFAKMCAWMSAKGATADHQADFHPEIDPDKLGPGESPGNLWPERDAPMDLGPWAAFIGNPDKRPTARVVLDRLAAHAATLDEIANGLRRLGLDWPIHYNADGSSRQPSFMLMRRIALMFRLRASARLADVDPAGARADAESLLRLGHQLGSGKTLIPIMMGSAIEAVGLTVVRDGLRMHAWIPADLDALEKALPGEAAVEAMRRALDAELIWNFHVIEQGMGLEDSKARTSLPSTPLARSRDRRRKALVTDFVTTMRACRESIRRNERGGLDTQSLEQIEVSVAASEREPQRAFSRLVARNHSAAFARLAGVETMRLQAVAALELERIYQRDGRYPAEAKIGDIVSGAVQTYRPTANGKRFTLYSFGWDQRDGLGVRGKTENTGDWPWEVAKE